MNVIFPRQIPKVHGSNSRKSNLLNQSNLVFVKCHLNKNSQRHLLWVGLHKQLSLKAQLELFATNITVLEMRWQHVPNLGCHDVETAQTITHCPSTWYNHVTVVSRVKPRTKGNGDDRWTDVVEVHWWWAMNTVVRHQCVMRWDTGIQWSVSRNIGMMWSFHLTPVTEKRNAKSLLQKSSMCTNYTSLLTADSPQRKHAVCWQ